MGPNRGPLFSCLGSFAGVILIPWAVSQLRAPPVVSHGWLQVKDLRTCRDIQVGG